MKLAHAQQILHARIGRAEFQRQVLMLLDARAVPGGAQQAAVDLQTVKRREQRVTFRVALVQLHGGRQRVHRRFHGGIGRRRVHGVRAQLQAAMKLRRAQPVKIGHVGRGVGAGLPEQLRRRAKARAIPRLIGLRKLHDARRGELVGNRIRPCRQRGEQEQD